MEKKENWILNPALSLEDYKGTNINTENGLHYSEILEKILIKSTLIFSGISKSIM